MPSTSKLISRRSIRLVAFVALALAILGCAQPAAPTTTAPTSAPAAQQKPAVQPTAAPVQPTAAPVAQATAAPAAKPAATTAAAPAAGALPADAATEQVLKMAIQGFGSQEPLSPWSGRWGGQNVGSTEFLSLTFHDDAFNLRPLLAASVTPNSDFTVWTVKLDPKAVWSDGSKVTAKNVKDSWEWVAAPANKVNAFIGSNLGDIKGYKDLADGKADTISGVVAKDDETVEVTLNGPDRFFNHKVAVFSTGIVPAEKLKADPQYLTKPNPLVNGPYQVTSVDTTGRQIVLSRNPKWWREKPFIERIEVTVAEEQSAWELLVERGQADFGYSFADVGTRQKLLQRTKGSTTVDMKLPVGIYSSFHWNVPPVDDLNVRKALIHAIDFKELATAATDGTQKPWLSFLHPELSLGCYSPENEKYFEYNPAKAKEELAASKYGSAEKLGKLRITSNSALATQKKALQIIQEMWRTNLGITDVEFKEQPAGFGPDEKLVNVDRQSIAARPPDDGLWMSMLKSNAIHATRFMAGYKNEALDKLADQITAMDRKDPNFCKTVQQAETLFLDDYMWIPLWRQSGDFGIVQPWVKNVKMNPFIVPYGWFEPPFAYLAKR
ncbi:MAG: ABC transporter substrate-binding protein [Anaerolineae bacterium]|nr:ABC transporter substrate-binding protein [Anaerolineae bacterium]